MVARDQYGTGELGLHSGECEERNGVHFGGTGFAIAELIDPDTGAVLPFEDGQQGEVVYTSIRREACPLLRMRSHDLMQVFTEPCHCGRTGFRFRDPRSVGRHVHRQGRQRLPVRRSRPCSCGWPRGSPASSRSSSTVRHRSTIRCRSRSRSRARCLPPDDDELAGEVAARLQAELNFTAAVSPVPPSGVTIERKTRRVVRSYRGEVE